ncbi:hypothetical protein NPX79_02265 [Spiroplasma endosymbiont of Anurida maritima]|uniref:hypothetical protein n=1 Tax=Spiroplasma endosymbiont of Anurida maritima TaxID=2967972 RepID=UPI0036D3CB5F
MEELYQENGDILNVLSTNPKFDKSKLKVETLKYISSSKGIGTATTYLDRIGVKGDTPLSDERENPVPNIGDGSIVPYLAGFNSMLNEKATGIDNPVSFIEDLGKKESFVNTVLYGSSAKINDSDKRDPIFWDEMPGILAFDKEYKQSFIGKNLEKEDSEGIRYNTNLKENYLTPIKNFVEDVQTYKFSGNIPKEEIIVQDEVVILAGEPNEGVLTETNVSDVGHINLVQWFYDGLPLDLVENVPFIATPTNNKPIEKLYRDILTYAYDLFIEEWNGGSEDRATSLLNNMWADSNNTWNNNPNTFTLSSGAGERVRYDGLNFFILNNDDYDKYNRFGNAGPPIIDAVDYVVKQQHNSIKDSHTLKPELLVSQNRNMEAHNPSIESNVVYLKDPEIKYTGLYALESKINSKTPNWRNYLSNIANNITLNINGIDFALNNYNLWQNNSESTLEIARWNLGMSALGGIKASATVTPKYTGNIW